MGHDLPLVGPLGVAVRTVAVLLAVLHVLGVKEVLVVLVRIAGFQDRRALWGGGMDVRDVGARAAAVLDLVAVMSTLLLYLGDGPDAVDHLVEAVDTFDVVGVFDVSILDVLGARGVVRCENREVCA